MRFITRAFALLVVFVVSTVAWLSLGGVMKVRTSDQQAEMAGRVSDLWGARLVQQAPTVQTTWTTTETQLQQANDESGQPAVLPSGQPVMVPVQKLVSHSQDEPLAATTLRVDLNLDQRRKGLMWFALYDVDFDGSWSYTHELGVARTVVFDFRFPNPSAVYDDFRFTVNGEPVPHAATANGGLRWSTTAQPGETYVFGVHYASRGMDEWSYKPSRDVGQLDDFSLAMTTDFTDIDFPTYTLSPTTKQRTDDGMALSWDFSSIVTGHGMGMLMPQHIQPGALATEMTMTAPLSLGLFIVWITILGIIRGIDVHPINMAFIAAAFFAFHLLFSYTADRLPVEWAFALSALVSVTLVVSYLRLVVSPRFALVEAGLAQLLYLVGFSLAHFWEGSTGLTVTVVGILTLFAVMQLTGRIRWSQVISGDRG